MQKASRCPKVYEVYGRVLCLCLKEQKPDYDSVLKQMRALCDVLEPLDTVDVTSVEKVVSLGDARSIIKMVLADATLLAWCEVMLSAGRLSYIRGALLVCERHLLRGKESLVIESAHPLDKDAEQCLLTFAEAKLGKHRGVQFSVNPEFLAGVRLRKGWQEVDLSLWSCVSRARDF